MLQEFLGTLVSLKFLEIFLTALLVLFVSTLFKYLTKLRVLGVSSNARPPEKRAAHFDCLRIGVDLSIVGFVSFLAVSQIALKKAYSLGIEGVDSLQTTGGLVEFILALLAVLFTAIFDSPEKSFKKGIIIPGLIGWIALILSAGLFHFLRLRGI